MPTDTNTEEFLTGKEVASILKLKPQTLVDWRRENRGPHWVRIGQKAVRYRRGDLESWIAEGERS